MSFSHFRRAFLAAVKGQQHCRHQCDKGLNAGQRICRVRRRPVCRGSRVWASSSLLGRSIDFESDSTLGDRDPCWQPPKKICSVRFLISRPIQSVGVDHLLWFGTHPSFRQSMRRYSAVPLLRVLIHNDSDLISPITTTRCAVTLIDRSHIQQPFLSIRSCHLQTTGWLSGGCTSPLNHHLRPCRKG